jgi:hypothetical protein
VAHRTQTCRKNPPRSHPRHRGSGVGDLNGDGRLDVVTMAPSAPAEIWLNDSPESAHWREIKLEGSSSTVTQSASVIEIHWPSDIVQELWDVTADW